MVDREKVIKGLECCSITTAEPNCEECPYNKNKMDCDNDMMCDALALLKKSFTPQEVYDIVVEHAQHDMRFKLGDKIDFS